MLKQQDGNPRLVKDIKRNVITFRNVFDNELWPHLYCENTLSSSLWFSPLTFYNMLFEQTTFLFYSDTRRNVYEYERQQQCRPQHNGWGWSTYALLSPVHC